jgi:tRNA-splicing ligase RtcB
MTARVRTWLSGRLDESLTRQIEWMTRQPDVQHVAVMPDVHQGRTVPNGVVVATRHVIYPELVGGDIGCGFAALRFDASADELTRETREAVLERLPDAVPTLKQPRDRGMRYRQVVEALGPLSCPRLATAAARDGAYQLGTIGRGNHFLELAADDKGVLWAIVHTGSRSIGQEITGWHLASHAAEAGLIDAAGTAVGQAEPAGRASPGRPSLTGLSIDGPVGAAYMADMEWACRYAAANRAAILNALADVLEAMAGIGVDASSFIDSPHNTVTREEHNGEMLIVHRKSANQAAAGRQGIIAGSMAAGSRLTIGLGHADALASSGHGAGRLMSRTVASERIRPRDLVARMGGITFHRKWAQRIRDEAPQAYRDLHDVMQSQRDLVRTERVLVPILNDKRP